jgi:hypothetical protein
MRQIVTEYIAPCSECHLRLELLLSGAGVVRLP